MSELRRLSDQQAAACENAGSPPSKCKCRCGGAMHGKARAAPAELPAEDPHHVAPKSQKKPEKKKRAKKRRPWPQLDLFPAT